MNTIPNEIENTKLYELFLAIYFNDIDKVMGFKNRYPELYAMKNNFQINQLSRAGGKEVMYQSFDLMNLTFFNQAIWLDDCWRDESRAFAEKRKMQTLQMLDYWRAELGGQDIKRTMEYNRFWNCFYCEDPGNKDEVFMEPIQSYLTKGVREIDLMLFYHAERFDFVETKKLLELGANPSACIDEDSDSYLLFRIGSECSYLLTCQIWFRYELFDENGYYPYCDIDDMFGDLLGLAAHEEMYDLLKAYSKEKNM
jgi:hypothetical protein